MLKSILLSLSGIKGLGIGMTMAVLWLIGWLVYYQLRFKFRAREEAKETLANNPGAIEAEVIRKYHQDHKRYPVQAWLMALGGAGAIILVFFVI